MGWWGKKKKILVIIIKRKSRANHPSSITRGEGKYGTVAWLLIAIDDSACVGFVLGCFAKVERRSRGMD